MFVPFQPILTLVQIASLFWERLSMVWVYLLFVLVIPLSWHVIRVFKSKSRKPDKRIPGPKSSLILGNMGELKGGAVQYLHDMAKRYGPIYKLKMLNEHWVVITDKDMLREVLVKKGDIFTGRPTGFRMDYMWKAVGLTGALDLTPATKTEHNLMVTSLRKFTPAPEKMSNLNFDIASDIVQLLVEDGEAHNRRDVFNHASACLIMCLLFGEEMDTKGDLPDQIVQLTKAVINAFVCVDGLVLDLFPWIRIFNIKAWRNCKEVSHIANSIYYTAKPKIMSSIIDDGNEQSVLHALLGSASPFSDHIIKGVMVELIVGGLSSTAATLHDMLCVAAHLPHIQEKIHRELDEVIGSRLPCKADRQNCHYTQATMMEVLRNTLNPLITAPRKATRDSTLSGYDIPTGTVVLLNTWDITHDPELFNDPYSYHPERYLDEQGHLLPPQHSIRKLSMPFRSGPRSCPGEAFSRERLFLFVAYLFQRLTVKPESKADPLVVAPHNEGFNKNIKLRFFARSHSFE